jgi:hypothetical protein
MSQVSSLRIVISWGGKGVRPRKGAASFSFAEKFVCLAIVQGMSKLHDGSAKEPEESPGLVDEIPKRG